MYIEPNTTVKIISNCPLDNSYEHTIFFGSKAEQEEYFNGITKYTLSNYYYQRVNSNRIRVQYKADDLYDCNYIAFRNTNYGDKWFYAFLRNITYVNNITSEIEYEIDVMQSWAFDYILGDCFIEREHSETDEIGDNLVPENLELGEYVSDDFDGTGHLGEISIVVASTFDSDGTDVYGDYYAGMYSGLWLSRFDNTVSGANACAAYIQQFSDKAAGIVSVFAMPTQFFKQGIIGDTEPANYTVTKKKNDFMIGDYTPKNKKLFTYPYNVLYVTNLQGNHAEYHYEYFDGDSCEFTLVGDCSPNPSVILAPRNYKGVLTNYDEKIVLSGYPQLAFNTDSFKAWLAQNASSLAIQGLSTAANTMAQTQVPNPFDSSASSMIAAGTAGAIGAAGTSIGVPVPTAATALGIANIVSQVYPRSIAPNQSRGGGGSTVLAAARLLDFAFMHKHITTEFARIIDDYFSLYGYAVHRVKKPNRNARPHWTYTKTKGCIIHGYLPADDSSKIAAIFNNGITFWRDPNEVGDYSQDNSV